MADRLSFPRLFKPASIGKVKIKNRLVMLPMGTAYASQLGEVTQKTIDYYEERAKGGAGLITIGNVSVHLPNVINALVLDSEWVLMGHYELAERLHTHGARVCVQLNCPGRQKGSMALRPGEEVISSSPLPTVRFGQTYPIPRALTQDEIHQWIEKFASAAARAKKVGYDMVELHGAHGYLINQFISPFMNKRTDEYGGSLENRMRFALELIATVRQAVGPDFPIGFRISAVEFVPGGVTLEESPAIARMLETAGVDYISVSAGVYEVTDKMICLMRDTEGWRDYIWEAIKQSVKVPTIAGGSLRHPDFCERLLKEGKADFIGLARPLFADPEWPKKAEEGRVEDIRLCISCNQCLMGSRSRRLGVRRCSVNAAAGRERKFSEIMPAPVPKRVMVIGGGPGGMEAARVAALRGHKVTLYEKGETLGGQLLLAGKPQSKRKVLWLRDYLSTQLQKLGVKVELGMEVTPSLVEEAKPDVVVVATGAEPIQLDIPGIDHRTGVNSWDLFQGKVNLEREKVAVVGGGMIGCEVAEYLLESANRVSIIEQLPSLAADMEPIHRHRMLELLEENNAISFTRRKAVGITGKGVQTVNLDDGREELVEADRVVIAVGTRPVNTLVDALEGEVPELYTVGDCSQPRVIIEAVYEGSLTGRQI